MANPNIWQNRAPGNLDILLEETQSTEVDPAVDRAQKAFPEWAAQSLAERQACLQKVYADLDSNKEKLAGQIALEVGKPLIEARGEIGAVLAKFALTFDDAEKYLAQVLVTNGPHPAAVRRRSRGPAAVIGPFNFPLHLGNGAILAHLMAGNTVLYKPSPLAPLVAKKYGELVQRHLPVGVFQTVQGLGETGRNLCLHPAVRSICFTGSVAVGRSLAVEIASDYSKDLALELGGKNALFVAADADLAAAAKAGADGMCLTSGQRCNGTSRIFVVDSVMEEFTQLFRSALADYIPGDPTAENTKLGPVISQSASERHNRLVTEQKAELIGSMPASLNGYYVLPAIVRRKLGDAMLEDEQFVPFVEVISVPTIEAAVACLSQTEYGLAASIFTKSQAMFDWFANAMLVGNVYANLPTTFSPSTLPFGGLKNSGNHHPGAKGFARFVADEQAVQWTGLG